MCDHSWPVCVCVCVCVCGQVNAPTRPLGATPVTMVTKMAAAAAPTQSLRAAPGPVVTLRHFWQFCRCQATCNGPAVLLAAGLSPREEYRRPKYLQTYTMDWNFNVTQTSAVFRGIIVWQNYLTCYWTDWHDRTVISSSGWSEMTPPNLHLRVRICSVLIDLSVSSRSPPVIKC